MDDCHTLLTHENQRMHSQNILTNCEITASVTEEMLSRDYLRPIIVKKKIYSL